MYTSGYFGLQVRQPLRNLIRSDATAVVTPDWQYEFLVYAPQHPVMRETLRAAVDNVFEQARS